MHKTEKRVFPANKTKEMKSCQGMREYSILSFGNSGCCGDSRVRGRDSVAVDFSLRNMVCQFPELPLWEGDSGLLIDGRH